jgi:trimeric autotransporter adhesin
MSTKTLRKRIALVTVSAMGFGLVSTVPAFAGIGAVDLDNTAVNIVAGVQSRVPVKITTIAATAANNDTLTITPTVDSTLVSISGTSDVSRETGGMDIDAGDIADKRWTAPAASANGVITLAENGDATEATPARVAGKTIGSILVTAFAPGSYTLTLTKGGTGTTAGAETIRLNVSPAQGSALVAQTLVDGTNGTIYKVSADTPTIMVTRPTGQPTSAGAIALRVVSAPEVTKFPVGSIIRAGDLEPGTGVTATSVASTFGTSYTFPALADEGLYEFTAFVDANANNLLDSSEASAAVSFRVVGIPDNAVASIDSSSVQTAAGVTKDFAVVVTLTDANGYPTYGAANAVPTLTESAVVTATLAADTTANLLGASTPDAGGMVRIGTGNTYRINVAYAHAVEAVDRTIRYTPVCPTTACTVNTRTSYNVVTTGIDAVATSLAMTSATGIYSGTVGATSYTTVIPADETAGNANVGMVAVTADPAVTTFSFTLTGTAAKVYTVTTTPGVNTPASRITAPTTVTTLADGSVTFVVTVTTPVAAKTAGAGISAIRDSFTVNVGGTAAGNNFGYTVTYAAPTAAWTLSPAATSNARVLQKSSNTVTAVLTDVYGRILAGKAYTVSVAGRNVSAAAGVTTAAGVATYTFTDADTRSYDTTVGFPTDTVTFSHTDASGDYTAVTGAVTYTYVSALAVVGSVTVTVPAATRVDQVRANPAAPTTIDYTATVRSATGAASGAGILVTFAGSADDIFLNGVNTGVTNTLGQATVSVYRNKVGFQTITATANGVSGTGTSVLWSNDPGAYAADGTAAANADFSDARNVTVTAAQSIVGGSAATVVARVTDRWGNPVSGVLVTWSISGVGRAVTGADLTVGTDTNGNAQVQVTSLDSETGTMTVTASIPATGGAIDLAGKVVAAAANGTSHTTSADVAGVTAGNFTAAGTVTFTKNNATSTADALLALATALGTRDQASAAVDAAAEATDAANAATDAANAAAEAADAATAAAQDAADAVAALSTQVSEMVAALKKQITSLTNLVIKIQKKVKA